MAKPHTGRAKTPPEKKGAEKAFHKKQKQASRALPLHKTAQAPRRVHERHIVRFVDKTNYVVLIVLAIIAIVALLIVIWYFMPRDEPLSEPKISLEPNPELAEGITLSADSRNLAEVRASNLAGKAYVCNAVTLDGEWSCSPVTPRCAKTCRREPRVSCTPRPVIPESQAFPGCVDQDGGLGVLTSLGVRAAAQSTAREMIDTCIDAEGNPSSESSTVREFFCTEEGRLVSTEYNCLAYGYSGCSEGQCVDCTLDEVTLCLYACT